MSGQPDFRNEFTTVAAAWRRWETHVSAFLWPVAERMLALADIRPGEHVLDVGCGSGDTTLAAALRVGPTGRVLAIDPVAAMIATARERAALLQLKNIEFAIGVAEDVSPRPRPFDAVLGRFSFIFSADIVATLRHVRSVMKPRGRIAISAWTPLDENPGAVAINSALRRHLNLPDPDPRKPGKFHLSAAGQLADVFAQSGFANVQVERVPIYQFARDGAEFWQMSSELGASVAAVLWRLGDAERQAVADEVSAFAEKYRHEGVIRIPGLAQVALGIV